MKKKEKDVELEKEIVTPLADEENVETLDEYVEDEDLQDDADGFDPDDPVRNERLMQLKKKQRSNISSIW